MSALLEVRHVTMRFGGLVANEDVNLAVQQGEILAVIGPNGAGKTTLFNAITGIYEPTEGEVLFQGQPIRRQWNGRVLMQSIGVGLVSGAAAVVALNATPLWQAAILNNYTYGQHFPWLTALGSAASTLGALGLLGGVLPLVAGFVLGMLAHLAIWRSQRRTPDLIARAGIARTFQNIRLFSEMNLVENVLVGMDQHYKSGYWACLFRPPWFWRERTAMRLRAFELLKFVELAQSAGELAKNLPYGHQRRLEIARALATGPKLILLDEPSSGLNVEETDDMSFWIRDIRTELGVTVLMVEHDMSLVNRVSDRVLALNYGKVLASGTPAEVQAHPDVIAAYLGA